MSRILKTQIKDYTKEMEINFFCILRQFINIEMMNNIINKVNYFNEKYSNVNSEKKQINNLYSDYGDEDKIMKTWDPERREAMLDKYYDVRKGMWEELRQILSSIFYLLKKRQWKLTEVSLVEVYPGYSEEEISTNISRILSEDTTRYYINIPLHETNKNMGSIIYYKEGMMKQFRKHYNYEYGGIIGHLNSLKWEIKQIFLNAREQYEYKLGDISIHRDITFHNGGTNNSNKIRKFLFIACDVRN